MSVDSKLALPHCAGMGRQPRQLLDGGYFHCMNRGVGRRTIFHDAADYDTFVTLMRRTLVVAPVRIAAYCLMPNHWHIVLCVDRTQMMSKFFARLLNSHTRYHHKRRDQIGSGPIYQGRFKAIPYPEEKVGLLCRYVERNPIASGLCATALEWRWSSHAHWAGAARDPLESWLERPFAFTPCDWRGLIDTPLTAQEFADARPDIVESIG